MKEEAQKLCFYTQNIVFLDSVECTKFKSILVLNASLSLSLPDDRVQAELVETRVGFNVARAESELDT